MPITLFVLHWNRPLECLETLRQFRTQRVDLDIVVIDNHSDLDSFRTLEAGLDHSIKILRLEENKGWGAAFNIALREWLAASGSSYCLISAHDATPAADCVQLLVEAMQRDGKIGIACPQYEDATVPRFSARHGVQQHVDLARARGEVQFLEVPHGTLMLVRRECLDQIGLFDERYFAYGDEHELGARAVRHGWKVALVWGALVANRGTWTPSAWRSYLLARNSLLLVHDYHGRAAAFIRAVLLLGNTLRLLLHGHEKQFAFSSRARFQAVRDYFRGQFGPPTFR